MLIVPSNISTPATITIVFRSPYLSVDLATVTGVRLNVTRRDGTSATWIMTIASATAGELVATFDFPGGDEITSTGLYYLAPLLTVPGGRLPAEALTMFVTAPGQLSPKLEESAWIPVTTVIDSPGPVKQTWTMLTAASSPYAAKPTIPWLAVDLSSAPITINLWAGSDGDTIVISDFKNQAASYALTLNAGATDQVPLGNGSFGASRVFNTAGFVARLKLNSGLWLPW